MWLRHKGEDVFEVSAVWVQCEFGAECKGIEKREMGEEGRGVKVKV